MADLAGVIANRRGMNFTTSLSFISTTLAKLSCEVAEISETQDKELSALREQNRQLINQLKKPHTFGSMDSSVFADAHSCAIRDIGQAKTSSASSDASSHVLRSSAVILSKGFDLEMKANIFREWKAMTYETSLLKLAPVHEGAVRSSTLDALVQNGSADREYADIPSEVTQQIQDIRSDLDLTTRCMMGVTKYGQTEQPTRSRTLIMDQPEFITYELDRRCDYYGTTLDRGPQQSALCVPRLNLQNLHPPVLASSLASPGETSSLPKKNVLLSAPSWTFPSSDSSQPVKMSSLTNYTSVASAPRSQLPVFTVCKSLDGNGERPEYGNCASQTLANLETVEREIPSVTEITEDQAPCFQIPFPPTSGFKLGWEFLGVLLLLYDMVTIPMQVFDVPANLLMWVMSWLILAYWCSDLILSFFAGYYTPAGALVMEFRPIARHYIATWFFPDVGIISVDIVSLIINIIVYGSGAFEFGVEEEGQQNTLGIMRIGKALRVLRLVRLVRIMKLSQSNFMEILQERIMSEFVFALCNICSNMLVLIFICHGCACVFYFVGKQDYSGYTNWTTVYGYDKLSWFDCYLTSAHWALAIFANGEIIIDPQSIPERLVSIVVLLGSMMFFSAFLGIVGNIVQQLLRRGSKRRNDQWILRVYLKQIGITWDLKMRVKRYINVLTTSTSNQVSKADVTYIAMLSKPLQAELQTEQYLTHFTVHPFFNLLSKRSFNLVKDLCCSAVKEARLSQRDTLFSTGETVDTMYFVYTGSLMYTQSTNATTSSPARNALFLSPANKKLACNDWFCEAALWTERWLTYGAVMAETDSDLVGMIAEHFILTLSRFQVNMQFSREYASAFVRGLNGSIENLGVSALTDVPLRFSEVDELLATYGAPPRRGSAGKLSTGGKPISGLLLASGGIRTPLSQLRAVFGDMAITRKESGTRSSLVSEPEDKARMLGRRFS